MRKIFYLIFLLYLFLTGCALNKGSFEKNILNVKKIKKNYTEEEKFLAADYYSLALAALDIGDYKNYLIFMEKAFRQHPASDSILSKYLPLIYQLSITKEKKLKRNIIKLGNLARKEGLKNWKLYLYTALCYSDYNKLDKAEEFYKLSIDVDTNSVNTKEYFFFLFDKKHYFDLDLAKKIFEIEKYDSKKLFNFLSILVLIDKGKAHELYEKAYQIYKNEDFGNLISYSYLKNKEEDKAFLNTLRMFKDNVKITKTNILEELCDYEVSTLLVKPDSFTVICDYKYFDTFSETTIIKYLSVLFTLKEYDKLYDCIEKKEDKIKKIIKTTTGEYNWELLKLSTYIHTNNWEKFKNHLGKKASLYVYHYLAVEYIIQDSPDSLSRKVIKVIEEMKDKNVKHLLMAAVYSAKKENKKAISEIEAFNPPESENSKDLVIFLANKVWSLTKEESTTYKILQKAKYDSLSINYHMAYILEGEDKMEEAIKYILKDLGKDVFPISEIYLFSRLVDDKPKYYYDLLNAFETYYDKYKNDAYFLNAYGYFIVEKDIKDKFDLAEKLLLQAIKLKPKDNAIIDSIAWLYYKKGEYAKAEEWINKLDMDKEIFSEILYHLGMINIKLKNLDKAKEYFKKAVEKDDSIKFNSLSRQKLLELGERNN